MRPIYLFTLLLMALCGHVCAGDTAWEIVKVEVSKDIPGYQEITVCNSSDKPVQLARHWTIGDVATANACFMPAPNPGAPRIAMQAGVHLTLFAEACHYPAGMKMFMTVKPGESVKAIMPITGEAGGAKLGLVLRQKRGRVLVGQLPKIGPKAD